MYCIYVSNVFVGIRLDQIRFDWTTLDYVGFACLGVYQIILDWTGLDQTRLVAWSNLGLGLGFYYIGWDWIGLHQINLDQIRLDWYGLDQIRLDYVGFAWFGVDYIGLDWTKLDSIRLDYIKLDQIRLCWVDYIGLGRLDIRESFLFHVIDLNYHTQLTYNK